MSLNNQYTFQLENMNSFELHRYPSHQNEDLLAWDTADAYLLNFCHSQGWLDQQPRILLVNDAFGALGVPLAPFSPVSWNDSYLSKKALMANLENNHFQMDSVDFVQSDQTLQGQFDLVLMKFPKYLSWWEESLILLRPHLHSNTRIISGGMIKHTPKRAFDLLEQIIGPTQTSLGWKKARIATTSCNCNLESPTFPGSVEYYLDELKLSFRDHSNVFSRGQVDKGSRLLISNLPQTQKSMQCADLGCGNGILALALAMGCPNAEIIGIDESFHCIASAEENFKNNKVPKPARVSFEIGDGFEHLENDCLDLVICNPPFHQSHGTGDSVAWRMFVQSKRVLRPGGEFRIVCNRHLAYHIKLKRLFGNYNIIDSNSKFIVLSAHKK